MSRVLPPTDAAVRAAAAALRAGALVAFPTETVYGLGADARDVEAVGRIFSVKGRPADHPVIVHLSDASWLDDWAADVPPVARDLARAFWPGPLTLVLRRARGVPDAVTGGQDTVGLRVPAHPLALRLLRTFGGGVAAPSANRFGRISPTRASHVADDLEDALPGDALLVLDGGPCTVGVESSIVDLSGRRPRLLRPGGADVAALERVMGTHLERPRAGGGLSGSGTDGVPRAPGTLDAHYAPITPAELVPGAALLARAAERADAAVLAWRDAPATPHGRWLSLPARPDGYARGLYAALRELDASRAPLILIEEVPGAPAWLAVRDRLERACNGAGAVARRDGTTP